MTESGWVSAPVKPPANVSDEATSEQLQLAREQGLAADAAVAWWTDHGGIASARMGAGEYEVTLSLRAPAGSWVPGPGGLSWRADDGNVLLAAVIQDGADHRPVPGLAVNAQVRDAGGRVLAAAPLPYLWAAPIEQYAAPLRLPAGPLTVRIEIAPPAYWRHDPTNGDRFGTPAFAEFTGLVLTGSAPPASPDPARADELAGAQGLALARAYAEMSRAVANTGAQVTAGDVRVAYAVEFAETFWQLGRRGLEYNMRPEQSAETNAHVEIAVLDARTGRFLPDLNVRVTVVDGRGRPVSTAPVPFMWHPWIHHYGRNWRVPRAGTYRLRVHVDPPAWPRAGRELGRRFAEPVDVQFDDVRFYTGQK